MDHSNLRNLVEKKMAEVMERTVNERCALLNEALKVLESNDWKMSKLAKYREYLSEVSFKVTKNGDYSYSLALSLDGVPEFLKDSVRESVNNVKKIVFSGGDT